MTIDKNETEKRELQKLLREYDANSGMARMVCGRPVELMPENEQDRMIDGFCTAGNLRILSASREKLSLAKNLELTQAEAGRVDSAIPILDVLIEVFTAYKDSKLNKEELRQRVRSILVRPLPESQEGLIDSLSHLIEALNFLSTESLEGKDSWDRMVDCVQLHDALSRTEQISKALMAMIGGRNEESKQRGAVDETLRLAERNIEFLESFFKGEVESEVLQAHFSSLAEDLNSIWSEEVDE